MSRRRAAEKREILPDPKYKDLIVAKFTNSLMLDGKKSVAERIIYGAFDLIESKSGQDPLKTFHEAIENVKPSVEVRSRRVGGSLPSPTSVGDTVDRGTGTQALGSDNDGAFVRRAFGRGQ